MAIWIKKLFVEFVILCLKSIKKCKLVELGESDKWNIYLDAIKPNANIVCAGVGKAMTFELELVRKSGAKLLLFDPSPTGYETACKESNKHPSITYFKEGLTGYEGVKSFGRPDNPAEGSWKFGSTDNEDSFDCKSLSSIMRSRGWKHIDLLKIDIEGYEYEVIEDILNNNLSIGQICVEFHVNGMIDIPYTRWNWLFTMIRLRMRGYVLAKNTKMDFTFINKATLSDKINCSSTLDSSLNPAKPN